MADTVSQTVLFPDLFDKPLVATFDQQHASSDGGAVLLKAAERQYGLIDGFAECLVDDRQPGKVRHTPSPRPRVCRGLAAVRALGLTVTKKRIRHCVHRWQRWGPPR